MILECISSPHPTTNPGTGRALSAFLDPGFDWAGVAWLRSITKLPIMLKGIQTGEDAVLAETESLAAEEADALPTPGRVPAPGTPASNAAETGTEADGDR